MPELHSGYLQGDVIPFYLAVKTFAGEPVDQPVGYPTIDISYLEPGTKIRRTAVRRETMSLMERGKWTYIWRVPKDEPPTRHLVIMGAILEEEVAVVSDQSFVITNQVQNPTFVTELYILENEGVFLPEVLEGGQKRRRREVTEAYRREVDIGLDDFAIEGVYRFGEYPNRLIDRRVGGRFVVSSYAGRYVGSEEPGGGPAQRLNDPNVGVTYTQRRRYRY